MAYPILTRANCKKTYDVLKANLEANIQGFVSNRPDSITVDEDQLDDLQQSVEALMTSGLVGDDFDAEASIILDQQLDLHPRITGDREFWLWLSMFKFRNVINWRFPSQHDGLANQKNYGVGSLNDTYPWYLWTRAKVSKLESDDPYELTRAGDVSYWRSHIVRVALGSSEFLPKEMTRWYVGLPSRFTGTEKINLVRELAKEMNLLQSTMAFECLSNDDITKIVDEIGQTVIERDFGE